MLFVIILSGMLSRFLCHGYDVLFSMKSKQHVSVRISTYQYISVRISMYYVSVRITYQYVSVPTYQYVLRISTYVSVIPISTHQYPSVPISNHQYPSVPTHQYPSVPISACHPSDDLFLGCFHHSPAVKEYLCGWPPTFVR